MTSIKDTLKSMRGSVEKKTPIGTEIFIPRGRINQAELLTTKRVHLVNDLVSNNGGVKIGTGDAAASVYTCKMFVKQSATTDGGYWAESVSGGGAGYAFSVRLQTSGANIGGITFGGAYIFNGTGVIIGGSTGFSSTALTLDSNGADNIPLQITGRTSQSANLMQWRKTSGGSVLGAITASGSIVLGGSASGVTAVGVLALSNGATAPTTSVDLCHLYGVDLSAGNATLGIYTETAVAVDVITASTHTLTVVINGTNYKILLST